MSNVIVYHAISPVHIRNVQLIAAEMSEWTLRVAYDATNPWLDTSSINRHSFESIAVQPGEIPSELWQDKVQAVIFSSLQPTSRFFELLEAALERGIPTIAIEESNQIALNQGRFNNYVLPVDHVLTASQHECEGMIAAGFPERRFRVTGWPFYGGRIGKVPIEQKLENKEALGLDPRRPVAALTLTGLQDAGESPAVRKRQLSLAAQGLPEEYQLVIKPHPIEKLKTLMPFVDECAPRAQVLEGMVRIEELLEATDVLLNRGVSQVCIEALFQEIPVIILDTGVWTPFHGLTERLIVENPEDLKCALALISEDRDWLQIYDSFFEKHVPFLPQKARALTCETIAEIARDGVCDSDRGRQWFDMALYQAWAGDCKKAMGAAGREEVRASGCPVGEFERLIECRAVRVDLDRLKSYFAEGFRAHFLRCLWVDQLVARKEEPGAEDLKWMESFPPSIHTVWFITKAREWAIHLANMGNQELAREFVRAIYEHHIHVPGVAEFMDDIRIYLDVSFGRVRIILKDRFNKLLGNTRHRMSGLKRLRLFQRNR